MLEVVRAGFLTGLNQADRSGVRNAGILQGADRGERRVNRIAVVRAAAAVELPVADDRRKGAEPFAPAGRGRLLIQVTVEENRILFAAGIKSGAGNREDESRRTAGFLLHIVSAARQHPGAPGSRLAADFIEDAVLLPLRIKIRGEGFTGNKGFERRQCFCVPDPGGSLPEFIHIHSCHLLLE